MSSVALFIITTLAISVLAMIMGTLTLTIIAVTFLLTLIVNAATAIAFSLFMAIYYIGVVVLGVAGMGAVVYGLVKQQIVFVISGISMQLSFGILMVFTILLNASTFLWLYNMVT